MNRLFRLFAILALAGAPFVASAASSGDGRAPATAVAAVGPMSAKERSDTTNAFVAKWGTYVKRVYGVDAATWAKRMSSSFAAADAQNFREALKRDTFEGAMAALNGVGNRLTDKQAKELLGKVQQTGETTAPPNVLGDLASDLVYTPLAPCRIVDTRNISGGRMPANSFRGYVAINSVGFTGQGGSSTDCGTLGLIATAVAINVTAVGPTTVGFATVYPFGTTRPLAASITYSAGANVNNALIVQVPNPQQPTDFIIYTSSSAHYVADIVGYFAPPVATALDCVDVSSDPAPVSPNASAAANASACSPGYTETATRCMSSSSQMSLISFNNGICFAWNDSTAATTITAIRKCCRVPGY